MTFDGGMTPLKRGLILANAVAMHMVAVVSFSRGLGLVAMFSSVAFTFMVKWLHDEPRTVLVMPARLHVDEEDPSE